MLALLVLSLAPSAGLAAAPNLSAVLPRGGQRGTEVIVDFHGERLEEPQSVLLYRPGISVQRIESIDAGHARAAFVIAPDCPIGLHSLRLITSTGISQLRLFSVGALPEIAETEPNNDRLAPQSVTPPVCINGTITSEDVDYHSFSAAAGATIQLEIEGLRLADTAFDPHLALLDERGAVLASADDTTLVRQDAILSAVIPADGVYAVEVREASFRGDGACRYRLHVGSFPRPLAAFPTGGKPGETIELTWIGDARLGTQSVTLPGAAQEDFAIDAVDASGVSPSPVPMRLNALEWVREVEPNDDASHATPMPAAGAAAGIFQAAGDADWFRFRSAAGHAWDLRVYARALRSPADTVLSVHKVDGSQLTSNDDAGGPDSALRFQAPEEGEFLACVRDLLKQGGPAHTYRLEIAPAGPALTLATPLEQQHLAVPRGNRNAIVIQATRRDFSGPLQVSLPELPAGMSVHAPLMPENVASIPILVEAAGDAPLAAALVPVLGAHTDGASGIRGGLSQTLRLLEYMNQTVLGQMVDRLPVAVTKEAPLSLRVVNAELPLPRDGHFDLAVEVTRAEGFGQPVRVGVLWLPPGVGAGTAEIAGDQTRGVIPLNANGGAAVGEWPLVVVASADVNGALQIAAPPASLHVVEAYKQFALASTRITQGQPAVLAVAVSPKQALPADTRIELRGLPRGVGADALPLSDDATTVTFTVTAAADAAVGRFEGVHAVAEVALPAGIVRFRSPDQLLIVDAPLPPENSAAAVAAPAPAASEPTAPTKRVRNPRRPVPSPPPLIPQEASVAPAPPEAGATLRVLPAALQFDASDDLQRVLVLLEDVDGVARDVTALATFDVPADAAFAMPAQARFAPRAAGEGRITVRYQHLAAALPVVVRAAAAARPISFRNDVEPALMKAGCNSGSCHGNARGQDGFRLSLFGCDAALDYVNLTRQLSARRVDISRPDESLMLKKGLASIAHGGGQRLTPDSESYTLLKRWVDAAAPDDTAQPAELTHLELLPRSLVLHPQDAGNAAPGAPGSAQLLALARYSDGSDRDVTGLVVYSTLNDAIATIDADGRLIARQRGETFVLARFGARAEVCQVIVVPATPLAWPEDETPANLIDEHVLAKLRTLRVAPGGLADDATFVRRVHLDVLGVLPTAAESQAFLADGALDKRARLIDSLLARPEFPELWAMKWAELLRIESSRLNIKGVQLYSAWLRDAIQRDVPVDRMVRELLTAQGGNYQNPPANFWLIESNPTAMAENVAQAFLGIRIQCAQCHNHPFERWTMDDYYAFAAFFTQTGRKTGEDPRETIVFNSAGGEVNHLTRGVPLAPRVLGGPAAEIPAGGDRRAVLAEWLTQADNPWFARCVVNRVWAHFLGRGLVEPPDDVRVSNPASHPELLDQLAREFVQSGYNMRRLVSLICQSRTYQRASAAAPDAIVDLRNYSHAGVRRLPAEFLLDAISQVTGVPEKFAGLPLGARATQIADARSGSYFLETFGRPARQSPCTCERRGEPTLSQALHLLNGATIEAKIRAPQGQLDRWIEAALPPDEIVRQAYWAALARPPTPPEQERALAHVAAAPAPREGLEDVLWALLNSHEFVFNH